jgi:antitoxin HigA-1
LSITTEEIVMATKRLDPIPPGEILLEEFMRPLGVSINRLARDIAVPPNRISGIVNAKRGITADTALRLAKYFGTSAETWLDLQSDYDLRMARRATGDKIEAQVRVRAA